MRLAMAGETDVLGLLPGWLKSTGKTFTIGEVEGLLDGPAWIPAAGRPAELGTGAIDINPGEYVCIQSNPGGALMNSGLEARSKLSMG